MSFKSISKSGIFLKFTINFVDVDLFKNTETDNLFRVEPRELSSGPKLFFSNFRFLNMKEIMKYFETSYRIFTTFMQRVINDAQNRKKIKRKIYSVRKIIFFWKHFLRRVINDAENRKKKGKIESASKNRIFAQFCAPANLFWTQIQPDVFFLKFFNFWKSLLYENVIVWILLELRSKNNNL